MFIVSFIKNILKLVGSIEKNLDLETRFSKRQVNEIIQNCKKENMKFFNAISKINGLSAFDVSYILSSIDLDAKKIKILEHALKLYNDKEFNKQGQTFSDYIFKVAANINLLNESNLELFKELAQCKSELYDFTHVLKNPARYINKTKQNQPQFCFSTVLSED